MQNVYVIDFENRLDLWNKLNQHNDSIGINSAGETNKWRNKASIYTKIQINEGLI